MIQELQLHGLVDCCILSLSQPFAVGMKVSVYDMVSSKIASFIRTLQVLHDLELTTMYNSHVNVKITQATVTLKFPPFPVSICTILNVSLIEVLVFLTLSLF